MSKRLQIILTDEAWNAVDALTNDASQNFEAGSINYSDAINEMILTARVDVKALQLKHTDVRRSLRAMASKETVDIDAVIKSLMELKSRSTKRKAQAIHEEVI